MRFRRRQEPTEEPCPRCGIPAPMGTAVCTACGWDLNESYHADFVGSRVGGGPGEETRAEQSPELR